MNYQEALQTLAPCGMDCARCVSFKEGDVVKESLNLLHHLEGYEKIAAMSQNFNPVMQHYNDFIAVLTFLAQGNCGGCRFMQSGGCSIRSCHKTHQVDFCFQCPSYPCSPKTFNDHVTAAWRANNDQMRDLGVETFCDKQNQRSRY